MLAAAALASCAPGLPGGGVDALANYFAEVEGPEFRYSIVSVRTANLPLGDLEVDEIWCAVIDQQVTSPWLWTTIATNRFVVYKEGDIWGAIPAEGLWGDEIAADAPTLREIGCENLSAGGK